MFREDSNLPLRKQTYMNGTNVANIFFNCSADSFWQHRYHSRFDFCIIKFKSRVCVNAIRIETLSIHVGLIFSFMQIWLQKSFNIFSTALQCVIKRFFREVNSWLVFEIPSKALFEHLPKYANFVTHNSVCKWASKSDAAFVAVKIIEVAWWISIEKNCWIPALSYILENKVYLTLPRLESNGAECNIHKT